MSTKNDILAILEKERGRFISGQELAKMLKLSRTSVWKAIKGLEDDGHRIHAVTNKGYRLDEKSDLLSYEGIALFLPENLSQTPIFVHQTIDSTNTQAKRLALDGAIHGTIVVSEEQSAGKGRYNRSFFSPKGAGLYMSLILRPKADSKDLQMITVAAAVAVCEAVEELTGQKQKPRIKWVNDIFLDGRKICGILSEAVTDFESSKVESIVVGAGINCRAAKEGLPEEFSPIVGYIGEVNRNELAAVLASKILKYSEMLDAPSLIDGYKSRSLMLGKQVSFEKDGLTYFATAIGINDYGNLIVRLECGESMVLSSGEVSVSIEKGEP